MIPFGLNPLEAEKVSNEVREIIKREYVEVTVDWQKDGSMRPLKFMLENSHEVIIDRILTVRKGNSLKIFAPGLRYYCQTGRKRYYLYYDGERWYIETKRPPG